MKILLDTHIFLWWITDATLLSKNARDLISDGFNVLYWSAASSWELTIKYALGRIPLPEDPKWFIPPQLAKNNIESIPITDEHAFQTGLLPQHHRDPFDRMLIAQSQIESVVLLSNDRQLSRYDVQIQW
jgi:PIN domain nuclease of toxin-antitoxin system